MDKWFALIESNENKLYMCWKSWGGKYKIDRIMKKSYSALQISPAETRLMVYHRFLHWSRGFTGFGHGKFPIWVHLFSISCVFVIWFVLFLLMIFRLWLHTVWSTCPWQFGCLFVCKRRTLQYLLFVPPYFWLCFLIVFVFLFSGNIFMAGTDTWPVLARKSLNYSYDAAR